MSLIIAYHRNPTDYVLASDSRFSTGAGGIALTAPKTIRAGDWLFGGAGAAPSWQWIARELAREFGSKSTVSLPNRDAVANVLLDVFRDVLPHCGPQESSRLPASGCDVLGVGPLGIVWMDASGCIVWTEAPYHAIGCADGYALGWIDCAVGTGTFSAGRYGLTEAIAAAAVRYPGVGGAAVVLEAATKPASP